ncbi:MAG: alpha-amylase, partial [Firmicutes bacterium]|nr:alpha-amylase [Bacillota bacterium]
NRGEIGKYLVTFIGNHDKFWQGSRFGKDAHDEQIIGAMGYLLCSLGTACIYYGDEQGFYGSGEDNDIREAMFDKDETGKNLMNTESRIYKGISGIAKVCRNNPELRFGRMYFREISGNDAPAEFGLPFGSDYTLAFSRLLYGSEVLVAYNVSGEERNDRVLVDASLHPAGSTMEYKYGDNGNVTVYEQDGIHYVRLPLRPYQFVILK